MANKIYVNRLDTLLDTTAEEFWNIRGIQMQPHTKDKAGSGAHYIG